MPLLTPVVLIFVGFLRIVHLSICPPRRLSLICSKTYYFDMGPLFWTFWAVSLCTYRTYFFPTSGKFLGGGIVHVQRPENCCLCLSACMCHIWKVKFSIYFSILSQAEDTWMKSTVVVINWFLLGFSYNILFLNFHFMFSSSCT